MKRFKVLLLLLAFVFSLSTMFSVNAFAYTVKYEYDDSPSSYDSSFYDDLYGLRRNPYEWDTNTLLSERKLKSGPFTMLPGASIGTLEKNRLSFVLFCSDESYVNFKPGRLMEGVNVYFKFSLVRQCLDKSSFLETTSYNIDYFAFFDTLYVTNNADLLSEGGREFSPILTFEESDFSGVNNDEATSSTFHWNKIDEETANYYNVSPNSYMLRLVWEVPSVFQNYVVYFSATKSGDSNGHSLVSDIRSYYDVVKNMNDAGMLEKELSGEIYDYALDILGAKEQDFTVEFLQNINDEIPFATKVRKTITIKALDNVEYLSAEDVESALNLSGVNALISYCEGFVKDSDDGIFKASYYPGVYMVTTTVDGKQDNYILDPNQSYAEFYGVFVDLGLISQDAYRYNFNRLIQDCPTLSKYQPEEVYGYWGYCLIPETYSVNSLFSTFFDSNLKFDGVIRSTEYKTTVNIDLYKDALEDYGYGFLARLWNLSIGTFKEYEAFHVFFYADCSRSTAFVNMNGAEGINNSSGLVVNKTPEAIEKAKEEFDKLNEKTLSFFDKFLSPLFKPFDSLSNATDSLIGLFRNGCNNSKQTLLSVFFVFLILLLILFVVIPVIDWLKNKSQEKQSKKKTNKSRKK